MAENVTLAPLTSLTNDTSAIATINANSVLIENAFADCLSLSGSSPNAMEANLDMNNFNILNLPSPSTINSPVRVTDLNTFATGGTITLNPLPVGGTINSILHKNSSTNQDATWTLTPSGLTSIGATSSTVTTSNVTGTSVYTGSSSGTTTLQASATASGTLTLPATTDTLVGKATTDTLTNKTFSTAGTGNVFTIDSSATLNAVTGTGSTVVLATSPTITTPGIVGVTNASNATAGNLGEYQESVIAVGSAASTGANGTVQNITSIVNLPAGDWDITGHVQYIAASATNIFNAGGCSLSTTSATHDFTGNRANGATFGATTMTLATNAGFNGGCGVTCGPARFNISTPTTIFLVSTLFWNTSTQPTAYGMLRARRIR